MINAIIYPVVEIIDKLNFKNYSENILKKSAYPKVYSEISSFAIHKVYYINKLLIL